MILREQSPPGKYSELGAKIHAARKAKRITQFELAEKIGVNFTEMSQIEHGRKLPTDKQMKKLAEILKECF